MFEFDNDTGIVRMYGDIGDYFEDGISEKDLMGALDALGGRDIDLHLKSDGGDVFQGLSIYNQLAHYSGKVSITIDAIAASIASVIAMASDDVAIHENSLLMIHNPWTGAMGDAKEFRGVADLLDKVAGEIAGIYARKSGRDVAGFLEVMQSDTYFTAAEALEAGLVDRVITAAGNQQRVAAAIRQPVTACATFPRRIAAQHRIRRSMI